MLSINKPLSDKELLELEALLDSPWEDDPSMSLQMLDGYLHAVAIGPHLLMPSKWLHAIVRTESGQAFIENEKHMQRLLPLLQRHYNSILMGLQDSPAITQPIWDIFPYNGKDYDCAEMWSYGFTIGMELCWADWQPIFTDPAVKHLIQPICLLGLDDYSKDQDGLTQTPAQREKLTHQLHASIIGIYAYWQANSVPTPSQTIQRNSAKTGRNDPCPCGSGKKYKKCCANQDGVKA